MKFSDELFELLDSEETEGRDDRFPGYQDQYTQGYLRGIETAENIVKNFYRFDNKEVPQ